MVSRIDDMMAILFPHMFEDIEYLVPAGEMDAVMTDVTSSYPVIPVAGPSRLQ